MEWRSVRLASPLAGSGMCTCGLEPLGALCRTEGKAFGHPQGGRGRESEKDSTGRNQSVGEGWAAGDEEARPSLKIRKSDFKSPLGDAQSGPKPSSIG